jgi:hypothetical protein
MKENIFQSWNNAWPTVRSTKPLGTGEGVIDQGGFATIEVDKLFDTVNFAETIAGQSVLYRSLNKPSSSLEEINAKQDAIKEIQENPAIRQNLEEIVANSAKKEKSLYLLLFGEFLGSMGTAREDHQIEGYGYKQYRRGVRFMLDLAESIYSSGELESPYLKKIFEKITTFTDSRDYSLMVGPVYNTEKGFETKQERKGSYTPATIFKPQIFKPLLIFLVIATVWILSQVISYGIPGLSFGGGTMSGAILAPLLLAYFPVIGSYDRDNCIIPLRDEFKKSQV